MLCRKAERLRERAQHSPQHPRPGSAAIICRLAHRVARRRHIPCKSGARTCKHNQHAFQGGTPLPRRCKRGQRQQFQREKGRYIIAAAHKKCKQSRGRCMPHRARTCQHAKHPRRQHQHQRIKKHIIDRAVPPVERLCRALHQLGAHKQVKQQGQFRGFSPGTKHFAPCAKNAHSAPEKRCKHHHRAKPVKPFAKHSRLQSEQKHRRKGALPVEIRLVHLPCRACQGRPYRTSLLKGKVRIQAEPEIVCAGVTIRRQNEKRHHANAKRRKQSPFPEHRNVPFQLPALPLAAPCYSGAATATVCLP